MHANRRILKLRKDYSQWRRPNADIADGRDQHSGESLGRSRRRRQQHLLYRTGRRCWRRVFFRNHRRHFRSNLDNSGRLWRRAQLFGEYIWRRRRWRQLYCDSYAARRQRRWHVSGLQRRSKDSSERSCGRRRRRRRVAWRGPWRGRCGRRRRLNGRTGWGCKQVWARWNAIGRRRCGDWK